MRTISLMVCVILAGVSADVFAEEPSLLETRSLPVALGFQSPSIVRIHGEPHPAPPQQSKGRFWSKGRILGTLVLAAETAAVAKVATRCDEGDWRSQAACQGFVAVGTVVLVEAGAAVFDRASPLAKLDAVLSKPGPSRVVDAVVNGLDTARRVHCARQRHREFCR